MSTFEVIELPGWTLDIAVDNDGRLTIFAKHDSGTEVTTTGEDWSDITSGESISIRLTCAAIEEEEKGI